MIFNPHEKIQLYSVTTHKTENQNRDDNDKDI